MLILYFLLVVFAILVITTKNPIYSILYLVLCFVLVSIVLLVLKVEFLALTYLMVYVGAIAVLFLFVVMMLDIEESFKTIRQKSFTLVNFYVSVLFTFEVFLLIELLFNNYQDYFNVLKQNFNIRVAGLEQFDEMIDWFLIGETFYNNYYYLFLTAGLLLLISMIGAIFLVLEDNSKLNRKRQLEVIQLLRKDSEAIILKKFIKN